MKRFFVGASLVCLLSWAAWVALVALRMAIARGGIVPDWLAIKGPVDVALDVVQAASMLACWVGSVYLWTQFRRTGLGHTLMLFCLLFWGAIIGPFYILIVAGRWITLTSHRSEPLGISNHD
jgi:hypothetical protein